MPRRQRIRRVLKWTGTIACILLATVFSASRWLEMAAGLQLRARILRFGVARGFLWADEINSREWASTWATAGQPFSDLASTDLRMVTPPKTVWWRAPLLDPNPGPPYDWIVYVPLWIPFLLLAIPTALLWRRERRRPRAGCCRKCDYDLTSNVSGRCPECGAEILKGEAVSADEAGGGNAAGV